MLAVLQTINSLLDIKLVQWLLVGIVLAGLVAGIAFGFKYNALRLKHALTETELAKTNTAITIQNKAIQDASEQSAKNQEILNKKASEASKIALQSQKNLESILSYDFSGECSQNVNAALVLIKKGIESNGT